MPNHLLQQSIHNRVATFTLNRPKKRNALNQELVTALKNALEDVYSRDDEVRVIVLNSKGPSFSAGADLASLEKMQSATYQENMQDSSHLAELFKLIYTGPKPVIAVINGHAIGGGCGLATMCDISISHKDSLFGYTETSIGFVPAIVSGFLIEKVGITQAKRLLLGAETINGEEAHAIKLITEVAGSIQQLEDRLAYWVHRLTTKTSAQALQQTKQLFVQSARHDSLNSYLEQMSEINARARETEDCKRGINAFLNKEKLTW